MLVIPSLASISMDSVRPFESAPKLSPRPYSDLQIRLSNLPEALHVRSLANRLDSSLSSLEQFSLMEASYVIVRMLQRFDRMENMEEPGAPIRLRHAIENRSGSGVQVRLHEAKS